jgi:lysophospholipase L1-like esterase
MHVVLCGDSIFDNRAYVEADEPDVVTQLRALLPAAGTATLLAVDGSVTQDVTRQLDALPGDATHLFVSTGGNDALGHIDLLDRGAESFAEVLAAFAGNAEAFAQRYRRMLDCALAAGLPVGVCTVYDPRFDGADVARMAAFGLLQLGAERRRSLQRSATAALTFFNDVILRQAILAGVPLVDLRAVCDEDADFANPIEPSARGGSKIAAALAAVVAEHDFARRRCVVYRGRAS